MTTKEKKDLQEHKHKPEEKEHGGQAGHEGHGGHHQAMIADFKRRFFLSLLLTVPILLLSPTIQDWFSFELVFWGRGYLLFILSSFIFFYGGWPFLTGFVEEMREKKPGMMTLIALALTVAYLYSSATVFGLEGSDFFWELATLIDVMLVGHWVEMRSILGASNALGELAKLMPDSAHLMKDGEIREVKISSLKLGDRILIRPGEKVAADGRVLEGTSYVNESLLTGESRPIEKTEGQEVIGGSINGEGSLELEVLHAGEEAYLSQVIDMVGKAQASKSSSQHLADRAALWLTIVAISVGALTLASWLFIGESLSYAIARMATVMVITCPHALGLATPLVAASSTAQSAREGLLIRNRTQFEGARKVDTVVFDKTGTLTEGSFGVSFVRIKDGLKKDYDEDRVVQLAASLEDFSEHPIGRGIVNYRKKLKLDVLEVSDFQSMKGKGVKGRVDGRLIEVVSPDYLRQADVSIPEGFMSEGPFTHVFLLVDEDLVASIILSDSIRESSYQAVKGLQAEGISVWMLTGDNEEAAAYVADELLLEGYFSQVLPEEKEERIRALQEEGRVVAMTGDGVNDAPALAVADVGIAIGSGTDVAVETADVVLVHSNPEDVVKLIDFGRATYRKMVQNLIWATGYNVVAIPLATGLFAGFGLVISPAVGAVFMSLSTVIVAINAKLLKLS